MPNDRTIIQGRHGDEVVIEYLSDSIMLILDEDELDLSSYAELTREQAAELAKALTDWPDEPCKHPNGKTTTDRGFPCFMCPDCGFEVAK